MSNKEEFSLHSMDNIQRAKDDKDYLGELIVANEALIRFTIEKYVGQPKILLNEYSVEMDDLLQVGRIAFVNAIKGFDCERGILFTSYVPTAIARDIRHYLRDCGKPIKMPRTSHALFFKINRYLSNTQYNEIDFKKVAEDLGESVEDVYKAWCIGSKVLELDKKFSNVEDGEMCPIDNLEDPCMNVEDEVIDKVYLANLLKSTKSHLSELEQEVLMKKIAGNKQSEIAEDCDITQMRVSRIIKRARELLDNKLNE